MSDHRTTGAEAALRAMEKDERTAFVAGFVCAGGDAAEAELQVESYIGCMRHHRATEADPPEPAPMTSQPTTTHTPGPWHTCGKGKCSCFIVMSRDHPVAQVTHGEWGDEYPSIRKAGGSIKGKFEAYTERIVYGEVGEATARANWRLIAAAPDMLALLMESMESIGGDWRARRDALIREITECNDLSTVAITIEHIATKHEDRDGSK